MKILTVPSSGSIAGVTFSRGKAGQIVRTRRIPSNPLRSTTAFPQVRALFAAAASRWAALVPSIQAAWNAAASAHPRANQFSGTGAMSGFNLFVAVNTARVRATGITTLSPPSDFSVARVTISAFTAVHPDTVSLTINPAVPAGQTWFIGFSQPVSNGVSAAPKFTDLGGIGAGFAGAFTISTVYTNRFGAFAPGQKIFARVTPFGPGFIKGVPLILTAVAT